jgi:hypothetical protein
MGKDLKKEIEQIKIDLRIDGFIFTNKLGVYTSIEVDDILPDNCYDADALSFADKLLDLLYSRMISPVNGKESEK